MRQTLRIIPIGLAMFSMFFGAGNVIFPLAVGQYAGDQNLFAMFGMIVTAVLMPFAGVLAMILYEGDYRSFFERLGKVPGFALALLIIALLGPLGSTPRCIAVSYSTFASSFPGVSPIVFSLGFCFLIYRFYRLSRQNSRSARLRPHPDPAPLSPCDRRPRFRPSR